MKSMIFSLFLVGLAGVAFARDVQVDGYYRKDGTYVNGYTRSGSNNTVTDNYSYHGNTNPYTGSTGTNTYNHDTTSGYFNGTPDSQGKFGHSGNEMNSSWGN